MVHTSTRYGMVQYPTTIWHGTSPLFAVVVDCWKHRLQIISLGSYISYKRIIVESVQSQLVGRSLKEAFPFRHARSAETRTRDAELVW